MNAEHDDAPVEDIVEESKPQFSFDVLEGSTALPLARRGDHSLIVARLRSQNALLPEERQYIADIIEGKATGPKHRPASFETARKVAEAERDFALLRKLGAKYVAQTIADRYGADKSWAERIERRLKADGARYQRILRQVDIFLSHDIDDIKERFPKADLEGARQILAEKRQVRDSIRTKQDT